MRISDWSSDVCSSDLGTSARSSGTVWIPDSPYLRAAGVTDDRAQAERYLASLVGNRGETALWQAFLDSAPPMLADLRDRSEEHTSELQSLMRISYAVFCLIRTTITS